MFILGLRNALLCVCVFPQEKCVNHVLKFHMAIDYECRINGIWS